MKLYTYWRSTSSFRVRIALALKGIEAEQVFVHLVRDGGEQNAAAYRAVNPQGRVPSLALDNGIVLTQSSAIIEYLDETYREPRLLPVDAVERAKVRAVAGIIGCDIHPLHNVSPLNYLRHVLGHSEDEVGRWIARWIEDGLSAVEAQIGGDGFCFGALPGLADVYLIPQVYAARRFGVPLDAFPKILRVEAIASQHGAFQQAHPANQGDAQ
jgi:maleylacetoacetate isomerase/maleylpyruvate isomerase